MKKKNNARYPIRYIFLLAVLSVFMGCSQALETQAKQPSETKENVMQLARKTDTATHEIPLMDAAAPARFETASFGLGWFWGIESRFGIIEGVIRTRVGYAGGQKAAPTYRSMGDHTETVQVDYDPARITYTQLLDIFWKSHKPTARRWSRQYMNAIFYHNDQQREQAMASKAALEQKIGKSVKSQVLPLRSFTMAEDYHQKYILKGHDALAHEMTRIYPHHKDFVDSTAAARLNGYAGGNGSRDRLSREIESLGLSAEGKQLLTDMVRN